MTLQRLLKLIIPTRTQLIVCILLAAVLEFLVFQSLFLPQLLAKTGVEPYITSSSQQGLANLNQFSIVRLGVQGLFWAIVGICAYIIYLALANAMLDARNEIVVDTAYANKGAFARRLSGVGIQVALMAALLVVAWITSTFGIHLWFDLISNLVVNGLSWSNAAAATLSILGFSANMYVLWILAEAAITAAQ